MACKVRSVTNLTGLTLYRRLVSSSKWLVRGGVNHLGGHPAIWWVINQFVDVAKKDAHARRGVNEQTQIDSDRNDWLTANTKSDNL